MKAITMKYYNSLRKTNPKLSKIKEGPTVIMKEAIRMAKRELRRKACALAMIGLQRAVSESYALELSSSNLKQTT